MIGIAKTLETVADLKAMTVDAIRLAKAAQKGGVLSWPAIFNGVLKVGGDVKELVGDAPLALPELKDVDAAEAGQIATAAYDLVKTIVAELAA